MGVKQQAQIHNAVDTNNKTTPKKNAPNYELTEPHTDWPSQADPTQSQVQIFKVAEAEPTSSAVNGEAQRGVVRYGAARCCAAGPRSGMDEREMRRLQQPYPGTRRALVGDATGRHGTKCNRCSSDLCVVMMDRQTQISLWRQPPFISDINRKTQVSKLIVVFLAGSTLTTKSNKHCISYL